MPGPRSSGHCSNPTSQISRPAPLSAVDRHTIQPIQTNPAFTVQLVPAASLPRPVPASCSNTRATGTRASSILAILPILLPSPIPLQSRCNHGIPSQLAHRTAGVYRTRKAGRPSRAPIAIGLQDCTGTAIRAPHASSPRQPIFAILPTLLQSRIPPQFHRNRGIPSQLVHRTAGVYRTRAASRPSRAPIATGLQDCTVIAIGQNGHALRHAKLSVPPVPQHRPTPTPAVRVPVPASPVPIPAVLPERKDRGPDAASPQSLQSYQPCCNPESHRNSTTIMESNRNWRTERPGNIEPGEQSSGPVLPLHYTVQRLLSVSTSLPATRPQE